MTVFLRMGMCATNQKDGVGSVSMALRVALMETLEHVTITLVSHICQEWTHLKVIVVPDRTVSPSNWMSGFLVPTHPVCKFNNSGNYNKEIMTNE